MSHESRMVQHWAIALPLALDVVMGTEVGIAPDVVVAAIEDTVVMEGIVVDISVGEVVGVEEAEEVGKGMEEDADSSAREEVDEGSRGWNKCREE